MSTKPRVAPAAGLPDLEAPSLSRIHPDAVRPDAAASAPAAPAGGDAQLFVAAMLEQSYRHLFGPTSQPAAPRQQQVVTIARLTDKLGYLSDADLKRVRDAFHFSDEAHLGQYRQSGEPYITHPVAVAEICAEWKLDAQSVMAALLHDVIEDQGVTRVELAERFDPKVAELVDGLTKLDKLEFQSNEDAQAENFRKMLLAMARDVRVILVKLADRLHNMRTLSHVPAHKRARIARETMEVYAPLANRLGLNVTYRELEDLSFENMAPFRFRTLGKAVKAARGNRRELIRKILESVQKALADAGLKAELAGREKTLYGIYKKMRDKRLSFSQVLDIYGFRVIVESQIDCYVVLGTLHALFKPMPGKFKDYIAIPKVNGYQSLHTTLVGPFGTPVEFQIRTRAMHEVAEAGVAAHWMYKDRGALNDVQQNTHRWLQSLLDIQSQTGDSKEFFEHVKIDLFPDAVYIFTPKGHIMGLPRGATALDFAYAVHSDLGNQCVAVKLNHEQLPLRTELKNGDIVEVVTAPYSHPNPAWLNFVKTGKARAAIRHYLKTARLAESAQLGTRLVEQAARTLGFSTRLLPDAVWQQLHGGHRADFFADIALGRRAPVVVAKRLQMLIHEHRLDAQLLGAPAPASNVDAHGAIIVTGNEGPSVQFPHCCYPIPGDPIIGYLGRDEGLQIHTHDCAVVKRLHQKHPDQWADVVWAPQLERAFDVGVRVLMHTRNGALARIAADVGRADSNVAHLAMDPDNGSGSSVLRLVLHVHDRIHLAQVLRVLRRNRDVIRVHRERGGG